MRGLQIHTVSWRYGRKAVLDEVSLEVSPGSFCALLGPNGAGKTTLFSIATRLFHARQGRVTVDGIDLGREPGAALARLGIVFQQPALDLDLSVRRNLTYFGALQGLPASETMRRAAPLMERLGLAARLGEKVRTLNGGHRRRLEIARSLVHRPSVLLLDEPTVGLDVASRRAIVDHVHDLCEDPGVAVLWATHLVDEVRGADGVAVLHEGRVVARGTADEVVARTGEAELAAAFGRLTGDRPEGALAP